MGASPTLNQVVGPTALLHDLTELPGLDVLSTPTECIAAAQHHAAQVFGAHHTWFLVNGSTVGIHAALMATCGEGTHVLLARNCHVSAYSGVTLAGVSLVEGGTLVCVCVLRWWWWCFVMVVNVVKGPSAPPPPKKHTTSTYT